MANNRKRTRGRKFHYAPVVVKIKTKAGVVKVKTRSNKKIVEQLAPQS